MIRIGLVGCGRISERHIEAIADNNQICILTAVCDLINERCESAAKAFEKYTGSVPARFSILEEMLLKADFEILVIATESGFHYEHARKGLESGKHVLIEKPMTLSSKQADDLIALANCKNLKIGVCHQNRFNPPIQNLRRVIEGGDFGKLINGTARILWNRNMDYYKQAPWRGTWECDGGTLMNQCIHNIDLLQWMMGGEPKTVFCQGGTFLRDIEGEDFGAIMIRFKNDSIGLVEGSACVFPRNLEETLSIFGEKGTVVIGGLAVNQIEHWHFENMIKPKEALDSTAIENVYGKGHTPLYKDFIHAINTNRKPLIDGEEGRKALLIILAAYKSRKTGQPVEIDADFSFSTSDMYY